MDSKFIEEMNRDYQEFMTSSEVRAPEKLRDNILSVVHRDLHPNAWQIFSKISLIHFFVGVVTLSLCPQFGVRIFGEGMGLMRLFASFGTYGCMAACGAFFVGTSLLVSAFILNRDELRVLKKHRLLQVAAITLLSLGAFIMADAEILFWFGLAWGLGSLLGGLAMLELGAFLRKHQFQKA